MKKLLILILAAMLILSFSFMTVSCKEEAAEETAETGTEETTEAEAEEEEEEEAEEAE